MEPLARTTHDLGGQMSTPATGPDVDGVEVTGHPVPGQERVLTAQVLGLLAQLHRRFEPRRRELLALRAERGAALAAGGSLGFLPETAGVRDDPTWRVAPPAPGLLDRRVEITGPPDRKMTINALNSGARVWLADFEDASTPLWENVVGGQVNLLDAVEGTVALTTPEGRAYALRTDAPLATIVVRPRGWHLPEKHIAVDGEPVAGALVDFTLHLVACGHRQVARGAGPYFYLPKLESHLEARLWNEVFLAAQEALGMPRGTIRATCLIETYPAAFEMEEILYELREHSAGLNAGRWDYLFSVVKTFRTRGQEFLLPDRAAVTMTVPFLRAYTELLVATCHRRGAHAIGGMAAFIPSRDPEANAAAFAKVTADKQREAGDGFDGSWVAHPGMVALCDAAFTAVLGERPHQLHRTREEVRVTAEQLLDVAATPGSVTEAGLRTNVSVGVRYLESWLRGVGAVGIDGLMEDAATAEICRSQLWQWRRSGVVLDPAAPGPLAGRTVTAQLVEQVLAEELAGLEERAGAEAWARGRWDDARATFAGLVLADDYADFLTLPAYEALP